MQQALPSSRDTLLVSSPLTGLLFQVVQALVLFVLFKLRGILATCQRVAHHGKRLAASSLPVRKDAGPSSLNTPGSRLDQSYNSDSVLYNRLDPYFELHFLSVIR